MRDHKKLRAFELADEIVPLVYQLTRDFPPQEVYGLTAQIRRAAISVTSNIVEGCSRESQVEYFRFLEIAFGSLREWIINSSWPSASASATQIKPKSAWRKFMKLSRFSEPSFSPCAPAAHPSLKTT